MPQSRAFALLCVALLPHNVLSVSRTVIHPSSRATNDTLLSFWSSAADPQNHVVVIPHLKLLICAVPKNACTSFKKLAQAMGEGGNPFWFHRHPKENLQATLKDSSWTKAVFLRDPLDRLISGFRSKCEPPMEGGGYNCMNFEDSTPKSWPSFDKFTAELHRCHNPHFDPQASFCSLGANFENYNFVGTITKDYQAVATQVEQLLRQAAVRSGQMTEANRRDIAEKTALYFPSGGYTKGHLDHFHDDTDVRAYYKNHATLDAALQHYILDYDRLPLKPPAWVSKGRMDRARRMALAALPAQGQEDPRSSCR